MKCDGIIYGKSWYDPKWFGCTRTLIGTTDSLRDLQLDAKAAGWAMVKKGDFCPMHVGLAKEV